MLLPVRCNFNFAYKMTVFKGGAKIRIPNDG